MRKLLIASILLLFVAAPALAKPRDVYPVSCSDLWTAVKDTLNNQNNYGIMSISDPSRSAAFIVVGAYTTYTDRVALAAAGSGCSMKAEISEVGADNADWRQFHNRLAKSLKKLEAAKAVKPAAAETGQ